MNYIAKNIKKYLKEIPSNVKLIAISKTRDLDDIDEAYAAGQRIFGENKVQELADKYNAMPPDVQWHFIGHLQTNKIKYIAPFISLIHSVDSLKLLKEINNEAKKVNRTIDCLLQLYIAKEETKFGMSEKEMFDLLDNIKLLQFKNVRIVGLMGMATFVDKQDQIRKEFELLAKTFQEIKEKYFAECDYFTEMSMGMSGDYKIAIECGSTMIRIGHDIFGSEE